MAGSDASIVLGALPVGLQLWESVPGGVELADELTGLANRRAMQRMLDAALARAGPSRSACPSAS